MFAWGPSACSERITWSAFRLTPTRVAVGTRRLLGSPRKARWFNTNFVTVRPNHLDRVEFSRELSRNNYGWVSAESLRCEGTGVPARTRTRFSFSPVEIFQTYCKRLKKVHTHTYTTHTHTHTQTEEIFPRLGDEVINSLNPFWDP
ncbi:hypothetical protein EVAR_97183_1 [Eumeta japonica]|uniref:Uncharacterized protein n=1 Tax=Eumeta variegata TaxID=151549 RepID=A0A4C1WGH7_EUMVA|nr:hypothetical protein EVAR_97183_1 [Eumeta japonica]